MRTDGIRSRSARLDAFSNPQIWPALGAALLFVIVLAVYFPILPGNFVMDDARLVGKAANPLVSGELSLRSVWFQTDFPLTLCVWSGEWWMWGENALGYHAVNILLQAFSAILLWRVLAQLKIPGAWVAAALFAVHPVCVGSVARIAELKNTLSLPFFLLSFWAYLRYEACSLYRLDESSRATRNASGTWWFSLSFVGFILALLSKTTTIALPVILLGCAAWRRGRITRRDLAHTVPFFIVALAFGLMSVWFQKYQALAGQLVVPQTFGERLIIAERNFGFYFSKDILPINLTVFYPRWGTDSPALLQFLPVILLAVVAIVCWRFRHSWGKHALFGLGSFTILLFPALGFVDAQCFTKFQVSDHLQYLPLVALLSLIGGALAAFLNKSAFRLSAVILLSALSILSFRRAQVFSTQESLLRDTLAKNPAAWAVHNDIGVILCRKGIFAKAEEHFKAAYQLNPNDPDVLANLALVNFTEGRLNESCAEYRAAIQMKADAVVLHESLAGVLQKLGKNDDAIAQLNIALHLSPKTQTRVDLAGLLFMKGDYRGAVDNYRKALALEPDNLASLNNLAYVLTSCPDRSIRNGREAVEMSERACRLTGFKQAPFIKTFAAALAEQGRFNEAAEAAKMISRLELAVADSAPEPGQTDD